MDMTSTLAEAPKEATLLIRTDFTNDAAWELVKTAVTRPVNFDNPDADADADADDGYLRYIVVIEDHIFTGATGETLTNALTGISGYHHEAILADARSMAEAAEGGEITVDYVDLTTWDPEQFDPTSFVTGLTFRCATPGIATIEANLSVTNLFFWEFAEGVPAGGVYRD